MSPLCPAVQHRGSPTQMLMDSRSASPYFLASLVTQLLLTPLVCSPLQHHPLQVINSIIIRKPDGIFLLNGCCDPFNEKALRASRGACFWIPIACGQWRQLQVLTTLKKIKLYAGEPKSKINMVPLKQGLLELSSHPKYVVRSGRENEEEKQSSTPTPVHLQKVHTLANITGEESMCLILGSEGQGLSEDVRAACSLFSISMPGRFESLNVAVAGGILLYMLQKQKR